jgi:uncharacterized membrane protein
MIVGGVASVVMPVVGIERPLALRALVVTWLGLTGVAAVTGSHTVTLRFEERRLADPKLPLVLLLPTTSILGSVYYEVTGNNVALVALLTVIALLPLLAVAVGDETWYFPLAVWTISLALLYHGRVPGYYTFTQPLPELTLEQLRWVPNYGNWGSLLANGVLFPVYAILTGLPIELEWNLVNTFLVSFLPVALYETFRRHFSARDALLSACLFAFAYPFYVLYPGAGRAATPVLFIALLGLAYSDDRLPAVVRQVFLLCFGVGVATTHYGTAYVVMFALAVGAVAFATLKAIVELDLPTRLPYVQPARADGGATRVAPLSALERPSILHWRYIGFYSVFAMSWYLYTANSVKFLILPRKVVDAVYGVLYVQATGSAVSSLQQIYVAPTIVYAQYLYVVFGLLMAIGIGMTVLRLVVTHDEAVDAGYLAIGIGFFSMFLGSALPSGNGFAVARVMMIIFTFAIPFAVVGARELGGLPKSVVAAVSDRASFPWRPGRVSWTALSVVIAFFLLLNAGVVSETVTNDVAPSNAISGERLVNSDNPDLRLRATACPLCNVETHVWVGSRIPDGETVYADVQVDNERDYYRGTLASQGALGNRYTTVAVNQTELPGGSYLVLQDHNQDLGGFAIGYKFWFYEKNMSRFTSGDKIYSNGYGAVFA